MGALKTQTFSMGSHKSQTFVNGGGCSTRADLSVTMDFSRVGNNVHRVG